MSGELDKMTAAFRNVRFYKLDMGKWDKDFVSKLRVRRLPTLKLFIRRAPQSQSASLRPS